MSVRLEEMRYVMYAEDDGYCSPFNNSNNDFPSERFLMDFFNKIHKKYPDYKHFGFESETIRHGMGNFSVQWYLTGELREESIKE